MTEPTAAVAHSAAASLWRLGEEALALAGGRPQDAGVVAQWARQAGVGLLDAADVVYGMANRVAPRGVPGLATEVGGFVRRRPMLFFLGTAAAGFAAARAARLPWHRAGAQRQRSDSWSGDELEPAAVLALARRVWPGGTAS